MSCCTYPDKSPQVSDLCHIYWNREVNEREVNEIATVSLLVSVYSFVCQIKKHSDSLLNKHWVISAPLAKPN